MQPSGTWRYGLFWIGIYLLFGWPLHANLATGDLLGSVFNAQGTRLPNITVTLMGDEVAQKTMSDAKGKFRFLDLPPGNYSIRIQEPGYSTANYEPVHIRLGRVTIAQIQISPAIEETIIVTGEPAIQTADGDSVLRWRAREIDPLNLTTDVWQLAGNEAPELVSNFHSRGAQDSHNTRLVGAGAHSREHVFTLDEIVINNSLNNQEHSANTLLPFHLAPTTEVELMVGGSNPAVPTPGILLNVVTQRSGNAPQAGLDVHFTNQDWQASPSFDDIDLTDDLSEPKASRIIDIAEYSGEGSSTLVRDHLWLWGAHRQQNARRQTTTDLTETTRTRHTAFKLNSRFGQNSGTTSYHRGYRQTSGSEGGPDRAPESTLRQREPSALLKVEQSILASRRFQLTGRFSKLSGMNYLEPLGGLETAPFLGTDGIWQGSYAYSHEDQEVEEWQLETAGMVRRGSGDHVIRFGLNQRRTDSSAEESWGSHQLVHLAGENFSLPFDLIRVNRPGNMQIRQEFFALWIQDTLKYDRWTLDLGLRHDLQKGGHGAGRVESNPLFPELLPGFDYAESDVDFEWNTVWPRLGLAYAFDRQAQTVLRASFGIFASRFYSDLVGHVNPGAATGFYLGFEDQDEDHLFDFSEPLFDLRDAERPTTLTVAGNRNDYGLDPERTTEFRLVLEHQFHRRGQLRINFVDRRVTDILETRRIIRDDQGRFRWAQASDYRLDTLYSGLLPDGQSFLLPVYGLASGLEDTGSKLLINGDRSQTYRALNLSFHKPLENRWMMRAHLTLSDWRWHLGQGFQTFDDPTDLGSANSLDAGISAVDNGGEVVTQQTADGRLSLNSRWAFNILALRRMAPNKPWGFNVTTTLHGREGFPVPYSLSVLAEQEIRNLQATNDVDSYRLEDVYTLDLRLEKEIAVGHLKVGLSLDGFNVLNAGNILEREAQLNSPLANTARQTLSPRVFRFGMRVALH